MQIKFFCWVLVPFSVTRQRRIALLKSVAKAIGQVGPTFFTYPVQIRPNWHKSVCCYLLLTVLCGVKQYFYLAASSVFVVRRKIIYRVFLSIGTRRAAHRKVSMTGMEEKPDSGRWRCVRHQHTSSGEEMKENGSQWKLLVARRCVSGVE